MQPKTMRPPGHWGNVISSAKKHLETIPLLSATEADKKELRTYFKNRIKNAIANRDAAQAANIEVIDAEIL